MRTISLFFLAFTLSLSAFAKDPKGTVNLKVTENGFEPSKIDAPPGQELTLNIIRTTDNTCATSVVVPSLKIKKALPLNEVVKISLGKLAKGEIRFGCGMNMMVGGIIYAK